MKITDLTESFLSKHESDVYDLLGNTHGVGPFDGGCVMFAMALQKIHGGEIVAIIGNTRPNGPEIALHAALFSNGKMIDADGPLDPKKFLKRFEKNELQFSGGKVSGYRLLEDTDLPDAPRDNDIVTKLVEILKS